MLYFTSIKHQTRFLDVKSFFCFVFGKNHGFAISKWPRGDNHGNAGVS